MSTDQLTQFTNCRLLRDHRLTPVDLWVRNGRIVNPEKVFFDERRPADRTIDCGGAIVSAGFIDLQINGNIMELIGDLLLSKSQSVHFLQVASASTSRTTRRTFRTECRRWPSASWPTESPRSVRR